MAEAEKHETEWVTQIAEGAPLLNALIQSNSTKLDWIMSHTPPGFHIDMTLIMMQHLVETIFPERADRQAYEQGFQQYLGSILTQIEDKVKEAMEAQGAPGQGGLVVPPGAESRLIVPGQ